MWVNVDAGVDVDVDVWVYVDVDADVWQSGLSERDGSLATRTIPEAWAQSASYSAPSPQTQSTPAAQTHSQAGRCSRDSEEWGIGRGASGADTNHKSEPRS